MSSAWSRSRSRRGNPAAFDDPKDATNRRAGRCHLGQPKPKSAPSTSTRRKACCRLRVCGGRPLRSIFVIVSFVEQTSVDRLEGAMHRAGGPAGIGAGGEVFPTSTFRIAADGEVARDQINLLPIFVDERRRREYPRLEAQQARAAAAPALLVERTSQDLLLDPGRIAGRCRPPRAHIDTVEFEMRLI